VWRRQKRLRVRISQNVFYDDGDTADCRKDQGVENIPRQDRTQKIVRVSQDVFEDDSDAAHQAHSKLDQEMESIPRRDKTQGIVSWTVLASEDIEELHDQ
jgi:hypothetical protein